MIENKMNENKTKFSAEEIRKIQSETHDKLIKSQIDEEIKMNELRNIEVEENVSEITSKIERFVRTSSHTTTRCMNFPFKKEYLVNLLIKKLTHPSLGYRAEKIESGKCNCPYSTESPWEGYNRGHDSECIIHVIHLEVGW